MSELTPEEVAHADQVMAHAGQLIDRMVASFTNHREQCDQINCAGPLSMLFDSPQADVEHYKPLLFSAVTQLSESRRMRQKLLTIHQHKWYCRKHNVSGCCDPTGAGWCQTCGRTGPTGCSTYRTVGGGG